MGKDRGALPSYTMIRLNPLGIFQYCTKSFHATTGRLLFSYVRLTRLEASRDSTLARNCGRLPEV